MGIERAEHSAEVAASPQACFDAIVDYPTFPEWQQAVLATEVLESYPDGRGKLVEVHVDALLRQVRYRLHYHYDPPHRIWWDFVEGDGISEIDGEYLLEPGPDGPDSARITYRLGIDPGIPVPGFVARRLRDQVMKRSVEDLKREAERRAA